jgi:eukaryotic-like serine/threonine-protein kinase
MITPFPTSINKYQIIRLLGEGTFGQVFHVFDRALGKEKAIKVLNTTDPSEFMHSLEEAQILEKCQHKHIVKINEANVFQVNENNRVILDLEYIQQGSLEGLLVSRWVSVKECIEYIRGALHGLEYAHAQGFLHRDVKPGNILLASTATKLSDFGLATQAGMLLIGSAKGYRSHLPPEYFASSSTNEQSDVFAVGVTLFRALSNIADWNAVISSVPNLLSCLQSGSLIRHIGFREFIPTQIQKIVRKACHPDPSKRYPSAHSLGQKLDALRFGVDWIRLADNEWQGYSVKEKLHRCTTDLKKYSVTVTTNGRRVRDKCQQFESLSDAITYQNSYVASTTLK